MKKKLYIICSIIILAISGFVLFNVNFSSVLSLPENNIVSYSDVAFLNNENIFGRVIKADLSDIKVNSDKQTHGKMWLKLFGVIPIKQVDVEITKGEDVYLGGIPLGFSIKTKGLLVVGNNSVLSGSEQKEVEKSLQIKDGDILLTINSKPVTSLQDVPKLLNEYNGKTVEIGILRDDKIINCEIEPQLDTQSGNYKIGLWVKDNANGVGTLTFVRCDNKRFGALGHAITDYETGVEIPISEGKIYKCSLVGITKAEKNSPGELRCIFLQGLKNKGIIEKNTKFGVYGTLENEENIIDPNLVTSVGSRLTVRPGKASIISAVSGVREEYEIEIIKTSYQPESDDKSFMFRVTDSRLLKLTGGILQGMSGSPILQNGVLIGAVTHVFVSDPTKGYGIYADWMMKE